MEVMVGASGEVRRYLPERRGLNAMELPKNATVLFVLEVLGVELADFGFAVVNDVQVEDQHVLKDGDELFLFSPIAGG